MASPKVYGGNYPYAVFVGHKTSGEMIFMKWVGNQGRHNHSASFEDLATTMMGAKQMKTLDEKIIKVSDKEVFIAYRKEKNLDIIYFVFAPLAYNKGVMRKLLRKLDENFRRACEECNIEKEQLAAQGAGTLNKKSIIKNKVMEAIDEFEEGVPLSQQILDQLDKNKALLADNIDAVQARNEVLVDQVKMSEHLLDLSSQFADKAGQIKQAMYLKRLKMTILMVLTSLSLLGLIAWKMGAFE